MDGELSFFELGVGDAEAGRVRGLGGEVVDDQGSPFGLHQPPSGP